MGKWTPNYTDNVLNTKISALITGAINRAAVEKEATITYHDFVNELDTGDAFTTSLVDVLVKELAERHTRPFQNDERRLIAPRTSERLISLANPRQVYRRESLSNRNHAGRRAYNFAEFMNLPTSEVDIEEEEHDFGNLLDAAAGAAEGARFDADLFEAYGSHSLSPIARRLGTTPSPPLELQEEPVWRPHGPLSSTGRSSTWAAMPTSNSTSSTSLTRHPSIRRATRRMVDFNDWTSRRRSLIRDAAGAQGEGSDGNSPFSLGNGSEVSSQTVRRFFPTVSRRPERRSEPREDRYDERRLYPLGVSMDREWSPALVTQTMAESRSSTGGSNTISEDRPMPRLRRRGVRPPETFYAHRYPWSAPTSSSWPPDQTVNAHPITRSPSPGPAELARPSSSSSRDEAGTSSNEPVGYPTPGSVDNEPASV